LSERPSRSYLVIAAAIVIADVLISATLLVVFARAPETTTDTITTTSTQTSTAIKTVTSTSTVTRPALGNCLKEVPQNSTFGSYSDSTSEGSSITYSNGTEVFFPLNECPVPVPSTNYLVDSTIEMNTKFIAAENGSTYEATNSGPLSSLSIQSNNSTGRYGIFNFILYGNERIYPCGGSYWTYNQLGLIQVTIPINSTGGLQFSHMEVQSNGLPNTVILCTTTTS